MSRRYYYNASSAGRLLSSDPGNISGLITREDPQSWNGYAYVRNSPLILTDPNGTNYLVCTTSAWGDSYDCADLSDNQYDQFRQNSPDITSTASGNLYAGDTLIGSATYYNENSDGGFARASLSTGGGGGSDQLNSFAQGVFSQLNHMPIQKFVGVIYGGSVLLGATAGAACYFICPEVATTTLAGESGTELIESTNTLNKIIGQGQRDLLRQFFKTGQRPEGLTERSLQIYKDVAQRAIEAGKDNFGVQAERIQMIVKALR